MANRAQKTVFDVQQSFAENFSVFHNPELDAEQPITIRYDLLSADQVDVLKSIVKTLIPDDEGSKNVNPIKRMRETLFESIWKQRKYTNKNLLSTIIYVLVVKDPTISNADNSTEFSCHPVFRTRKCHRYETDREDTSDCCMIFIDETGRVYQNWELFTKNNVLPAGMMIAPKNGIYTMNEENKVELEYFMTPNSNKLLFVADTASTSVAVIALGVSATALAMPVAAPVVACAGAAAMGTAIYSSLRSVFQLKDRADHEQTINLSDREARNNWLSLAAGVVCAGASASTSSLTKAVTTGRNISKATTIVVNGLNVTSIVLSGTGIFNGALDLFLKYQDDEKISILDVTMLSASLLLFTHSVYNFKLASRIIDETKSSTIKAYRDKLSNRNRKQFDKLSRQSMGINGPQQGKADIIRVLNETPSTSELKNMLKLNRAQIVQSNQNVAFNHENNAAQFTKIIQQAELYHSKKYNQEFKWTENSMVVMLKEGFLYISKTLNSAIEYELPKNVYANIMNKESFKDIIDTILKDLGDEELKLFLNILIGFFDRVLKDVEKKIKAIIPSETVLYRIFINYAMQQNLLSSVYAIKDEIREKLRDYFRTKINFIIEDLKKYFEAFSPRNSGLAIKCLKCPGYFSECNLVL